MKKLQILMPLAAMALLASCSSNEPAASLGDQLVTVNIGALLSDNTLSRADESDDPVATRCFMQIIDNTVGTDHVEDQIVTLTPDQTPNLFSADVSLYKDKTYTMLFWADADDGTVYTATNLKNVVLNNGQEAGIAWAGNQVNGASTYCYNDANGADITATLTHVVAKVTLMSSTPLDEDLNVSISGTQVGSSFDVSTMALAIPEGASAATLDSHSYSTTLAAAITQEDIDNAKTSNASGVKVFSYYALVNADADNATLKIKSGIAQEIEVSSVPVKANLHTILVGDVTGQSNVTFAVTCDTDWTYNSPEETPIP